MSKSPARVLLCVEGPSAGALLDAAVPLLSPAVLWVPTHVVDARGKRDLGFLRSGLIGAGRLAPSQLAAIDAAAIEHTRGTLEMTEAALLRRGLACEPAQIRSGEPGREICGVASAIDAEAIVLFASRRARVGTGPHSVGHTARFVVDHAPCPVLVLREGG